MALLYEDFKAAVEAKIIANPVAFTAYKSGDPRLLAQIDAAAVMLTMLSQQIDVAEVEPFVKARDGTVLADASLKGILPLSRAAQVTISLVNNGIAPVTLTTGRVLVDQKGRRYRLNAGVTVNAGATVSITAVQGSTRAVTHTVAGAGPFYEVQVPASPDGLHLVGLEVSDGVGPFTYSTEFANVNPGDRIYHVETDEYRRMWIRFGATDATLGMVIGHQVVNGDVLTINLTECDGKVDLTAGAGFNLENIVTLAENDLAFTLASLDSAGADPMTIEVMRMLSKYPALYDDSAVYLGNFDFLIRKHMAGFNFLAVWNEQIEEQARGASVNNINKLFVAFELPSMTTAAAQASITQIVAKADSSYKVVFKAQRNVPMPVTITAEVGIIHDVAVVTSQIKALIIAQYGPGSVNASRGLAKVYRVQEIHEILKLGVPALQDQLSDFSVTVGTYPTPLPEDYRYIDLTSLTVTVTNVQHSVGLWSH